MLKTILNSLNIPGERVRLEWISASEGRRFAETITGMVDDLKKLGPSSLKTTWEL